MNNENEIKRIIDLFEDDNLVESKKVLSEYIKEHKKQYLADKIGLKLNNLEH